MFKHNIPLSFLIGGTSCFVGIFFFLIFISMRIRHYRDFQELVTASWKWEHIYTLGLGSAFFIFGVLFILKLNWARISFLIVLGLSMIVGIYILVTEIFSPYSRLLESIALSILFFLPPLFFALLSTQKAVVEEFTGEESDEHDDILDF